MRQKLSTWFAIAMGLIIVVLSLLFALIQSG
jgi:uncharacterized integral membrane protein